MIAAMADTPPLFQLYDLRGRPQYIAHGHYKSLLTELVFLTGLREWSEKTWLRIQNMYPRHEVKDRPTTLHWKTLTGGLSVPVEAALFWRTDWYKVTHSVGAIKTDDRQLFVKIYKRREDAALAVQQASFIQHYFSDYFTTVPALNTYDNIVIFPLLPHQTKSVPHEVVQKSLLDNALNHLKGILPSPKAALDHVNLNLPSLLQKNGEIHLWHAIRELLATVTAIPTVPVHGDVTPWNIFMSDSNLPVLIDYERAGWHVPFYDCWHYYCQPLVLKGHVPDLLRFIDNVHQSTHMDKQHLVHTALLYLLDQLAHDLQDKDDYPKQTAVLGHIAGIKLRLVKTLLQHLGHG